MALINCSEAAEKMNIGITTVYDLCRADIIPNIKIGRQVKLDEDKLDRWLDMGGSSEPGVWRTMLIPLEKTHAEGASRPVRHNPKFRRLKT